MADLTAGSKVRGGDTPPTVGNAQAASYTATNTTYGVAGSAGYADCGVAFVASTTGRAIVYHFGQMENLGVGAFATIAPVIRNGSVVGSGSVVLAATDDNALVASNAMQQSGMPMLVTGLAPGASYNVRLEHRVSGGTGTFLRRRVNVAPAT